MRGDKMLKDSTVFLVVFYSNVTCILSNLAMYTKFYYIDIIVKACVF